MVSFYLAAFIVAAIIVHTIQTANREALPARQRARELNLRIYRYLHYRNDATGVHRISGHRIRESDKRAATGPENEFEELIISIYRDDNFYRKINGYARGYKILFWRIRPTEHQIWDYRLKHVGRSAIAEDYERQYRAYLQKNIWYTDSQGIEKNREISNYNEYRLKQLLPADIFTRLEQLRTGQEGKTEGWEYVEHPDRKPAATIDTEHPDPIFEIGNDYLEERERLSQEPLNETNTIELPVTISPYRPKFDIEKDHLKKPSPIQEIPVLEIEL